MTTLLNATFTFGSTEPLGRLECQLGEGFFGNCTSPLTLSELPFGAHRFRVRAVDRAGNVDRTPGERNWTILAKDVDGDGFNQRNDCNDGDERINPLAYDISENGVDENCDGGDAVNLDRDGDGLQRPGDCDDGNPFIRPGGIEIRGDEVDEDCDGTAEDYLANTAIVSVRWSVAGRRARLTKLAVKQIPRRGRAEVRCHGKKCRFRREKLGRKPQGGTIKGLRKLKQTQRRFRAGQTMEVRVMAPDTFGKVVRYTMEPGEMSMSRSS